MLTIAIPTMRRFSFLKESLPVYLAHPGVGEVLVCDETGEDCAAIEATPFTQNPKLRLVRNEKRLGIYQNKRKAMTLATCPFVACLDSDNHFDEEWLDTITNLLKKSDGKTIYASADFKCANIDTGGMTYPCEEFSGLKLDAASWNTIFKIPRWNFLLNDGNWVVPYKACLALPEATTSESLEAADAIYMLREFVSKGFVVYYVPDLAYLHTVHSDSSWLKSEAESTRILNETDWRL
jgi:hypothetical protein